MILSSVWRVRRAHFSPVVYLIFSALYLFDGRIALADFIVDAWTTSQNLTVTNLTSVDSSTTAPESFSGVRLVQVRHTPNLNSLAFSAAGGFATISATASPVINLNEALFTWGSPMAQPVTPVDLLADGGFGFAIQNITSTKPAEVDITVSNGSNLRQARVTIPILNNQSYEVLFSQFTFGLNASPFSAVTAIDMHMKFEVEEAFSFTMGTFKTLTVIATPEPGILAICGLAASGLMGLYRKRKRPCD